MRRPVRSGVVLPADGYLPPPAARAASVVIGALRGSATTGSGRALVRLRPGGLVLFAADFAGRRPIRGIDRATVLFVDQEGGSVARLRGVGPPAAHRLRAAPAADVTRLYRTAAVELRRRGVHVNLAPVADIDRGGAIAGRALGTTPGAVAPRVASAVRGLQLGGVEACVKHYPGLGTVAVNTDDAVAIDRRAPTAILADLAPFRAAVRAGVRCVMVSSVVVPRLCPRPQVLCPSTYRRLRALGFDGAIVTDSLNAAALRAYGTPAQLAIAAFRAGADGPMLTSPGSSVDAIAAIDWALRHGRLSEARVRASAARLSRLR